MHLNRNGQQEFYWQFQYYQFLVYYFYASFDGYGGLWWCACVRVRRVSRDRCFRLVFSWFSCRFLRLFLPWRRTDSVYANDAGSVPQIQCLCLQRITHLQRGASGTRGTLTTVPRSTQPSTLRGTTVKWVSALRLSKYKVHGDGLMLGLYSSLQAVSKVKFSAYDTSWRPPGADRLSLRWLEWPLVYGFAVDDSIYK